MIRLVTASTLVLLALLTLAPVARAQLEPPTTNPPPTVPPTEVPTTERPGGVVTTAPPRPATTAVRRTTTSSSLLPSTTLFTVPTPAETPAGPATPTAAPKTGNGEISGFYALLSGFGFLAVIGLLALQWYLTRPGRRGWTL